MDTHHFVVSEVFPDGRVMIFAYVRIGQKITAIMDVYTDGSLTEGKRYLDVHLNNNHPIKGLGSGN